MDHRFLARQHRTLTLTAALLVALLLGVAIGAAVVVTGPSHGTVVATSGADIHLSASCSPGTECTATINVTGSTKPNTVCYQGGRLHTQRCVHVNLAVYLACQPGAPWPDCANTRKS